VRTHNHLLEWYQGADGIKTGFVNASGFNLAASAVRDGRRLVGVIMGGHSARGRDVQMASLLDQGFALLAGGRRPAPQTTTVVAAAAPPPAAYSAPAAAAASAAPAATAPVVVAGPIVDSAPPPRAVAATVAATAAVEKAETAASAPSQKPETLRRVASAALRHLAPVSQASAAPAVMQTPASQAGDDWAIQLGAFRAEAAAEKATKRAAGLAIVRGKPHQILAPAKSERGGLYRARLLRFNEKTAQAACAELKRRGLACSVIRVATVKVARG
jgi:D-alanyl-D-alanine carboxypeptidase